ncbi:MAG: ATP-binding cassette domain-containing protein [Candidatus Devosia euplotis]|nr:ATP-binding cassette domain-containing protein [Candidatus Devosia euplotis]
MRIRNATKKFGDIHAVADASLDIYKSELFCLLGGSGSGKSTPLRMLAVLEEPISGSIEIDGQNMTHVAPYNRPVNMMFQSYALLPRMNVEQNIAYGLKRDNLPRGEIADRVAELLSLVKLADYGARKSHQLSGGSVSASLWPRLSPSGPSCCSTSRSAHWSSSCARKPSSNWSRSRRRWASPLSSSLMTRKRR